MKVVLIDTLFDRFETKQLDKTIRVASTKLRKYIDFPVAYSEHGPKETSTATIINYVKKPTEKRALNDPNAMD